jgi:3alpha(or 20beta)-hydroxysteroid dehydrogenase
VEGLEGRVAVISGAGGGIGRAVCLRLAAEGADLVATDLAGSGLPETVDAVRAAGGRCEALEADVTQRTDWDATRVRAVDVYGGVDVVVNNAGVEGAITRMVEYPEDVFDRVLAVNVKGVWLGMATLAPVLAERGGGAIVNVASVAGLGGSSMLSAYSASKHAVVGLTRSAALELGAQRIRVNAVCPSPIETRMMRSLEEGLARGTDTAAVQALVAAQIPLGRYGTPDEVAALIAFLASDDARFLSGAAIPIDGAMKAR